MTQYPVPGLEFEPGTSEKQEFAPFDGDVPFIGALAKLRKATI